MTIKPLSRRLLLRGLGVSLALPGLEAMTGRARADGGSPFRPWAKSAVVQPRVIFCYVPNGKNIFQWLPPDTGASYRLSPTLAVLKDHRKSFSVLSGLGHPHAQGGHSGADTWLSGANLKAVPGSEYTNTVSIDQLIAEQHGKATRFPSLQLGDLPGTGNPGHSNTVSFDAMGTPLPAETSPRRLFERLFAPESSNDRAVVAREYAQRRSILDAVLDDTNRLRARVGKGDQQRLDRYLTSVRSTEARVQRLESWIDRPKAKVETTGLRLNNESANAHDRPAWLDVMLELSYLAFITDTTRVITFEWSREASGMGGNGENHHDLSHHGGDEGMLAKLAEVDRFHVGRLSRFLGLLSATPEGDGVMLDRTIVVYGSGMNSGKGGEHSPFDLPLLIAGGRALGLHHGSHHRFEASASPPLSNVWLTLARKMGLSLARFSDASGSLKELG
jgi:hypothetical protein